METFARVFLGIQAATIGSIGLVYLYDPNVLLRRYQLDVTRAGLDNMLRGSYGGLFAGMAAIFACGALMPERTADVLLFTLLFMGGIAGGRIVSILRRGSPGLAINGLLGYELVAAAIAAGLYAQRAA